MADSLSKSELLRYSRHLLLPELGTEGQERFKSARILVVGAGGLGSPVILYLAAAGVGKIGIVDFDKVDLSNLQRQIIYRNSDVGESKVKRASEHAQQLNPEIELVEHDFKLSSENAIELFNQYDVIIDGTDNFATRYLVNDACVLTNKPNVYGSIYRFEGQASVFVHDGGPCYRCIFPTPPPQDAVPNCAEGGVLGVMAGLIGCVQATEALKIVLNKGETLRGSLLLYDALSMKFDKLRVPRDPDCKICGSNPTITKLQDIVVTCSTNTVSASDLHSQIKSGDKLVLLDVRTPEEVAICRLENSINIPIAELQNRLNELDKQADIVVYCKSGARSAKAAELLTQHNFAHVRNLEGGILAWIRDVDLTLNAY
ncbi:MAG: molybdopterin-synthase adenylyltransferase MoeB [Candidatus Obscuribacterales bacterium]|nr:molybdopterin-synthase adenylyltransferase MoeB [Candidatus Obscuribacterales bacterium]